jgi:hypothetical protein
VLHNVFPHALFTLHSGSLYAFLLKSGPIRFSFTTCKSSSRAVGSSMVGGTGKSTCSVSFRMVLRRILPDLVCRDHRPHAQATVLTIVTTN